MGDFMIAAAQIGAVKGDIAANIKTHLRVIGAAAAHCTRVIVFPELSLTGYEPELAEELALETDDPRLLPLKRLAIEHDMVIVVGAPLRNHGGKPFLGSLALDSAQTIVYHKYHLHPGEENYFTPGEHESCVIHKDGEAIALAICADVDHSSHAAAAAASGATVYAAGVLMMNGYGEALQRLQQYARQYQMAVVMANYNAPTGEYIPAGQSVVLDHTGNILAKAGPGDEALVLLSKKEQQWSGKVNGGF